ncbi:MAG: hypothetical protein NW224_21915 [Leptolyngbyaceae cyanobacterium bins.302]|nr:hypothetical protein [Leptolyngbyaceae cyanobacterium bins.302]
MSLTTLQGMIIKLILGLSLAVAVLLGGCSSQSNATISISDQSLQIPPKPAQQVSEVSPPNVIQQLRQLTEGYQPQVSILSPKPDEVLNTDQVNLQFQVNGLPLFNDPDLGMGPHLEVILDNQPYFMVYDLSQPFTLQDLEPGTHTLRVFAARPWHESFKNEGAYVQTTFHVFTKTDTNTPNPALPLLSYSRPTGTYGAEPILLDFYLTNAPLHLVAQESAEDDIGDWRIRCTVNGESFVVDRWQPIYLKGFKKGKNWVKLELLNENGEPIKNEFNTTVRVFNYEPNGQDTLSKLMRGKLTLAQARGMVDATYTTPEPEQPTEPQPTETAPVEPSPEPSLTTPAEAPEPAALPEDSLETASSNDSTTNQPEPVTEVSPNLAQPETPAEILEAPIDASPVPNSEPEINAKTMAEEAQSSSPEVESASPSMTVPEAETPTILENSIEVEDSIEEGDKSMSDSTDSSQTDRSPAEEPTVVE